MTTGLDPGTWWLKKTARRGVVLASRLCGRARSLVAGQVSSVRAVTYHRFAADRPRDPFCLHPLAFEAHMRWLAERGLAISLAELAEHVAGGAPARDGAVLVTIDDGHRSSYAVAAPILQRYAIPAVMFVSTGLVGAAGAPEPYMSWDELCALARRGVTIGSHAHTHRSLARMQPEEACEEAVRSRQILQERLGVPVTAFAYPYGTPSHYSDATAAALRDAGYEHGFVSTHGAIFPGAERLRLPRVKVEGGESEAMFRSICAGGMDGWAVLDHAVCQVRDVRARLFPAKRPG